ncbi:hypothetical protein [Streptomyces sp. NPDC101234]
MGRRFHKTMSLLAIAQMLHRHGWTRVGDVPGDGSRWLPCAATGPASGPA